MRMDVAADVGGFTVSKHSGEPWWHASWLPFAESEGDAQVFDLRPGPGFGRLGFAVHDSTGDFTTAWPSLAAYLTATAEALVLGGDVHAWYPYLTVQGELWWGLGGQMELNGEP